MTDDALELKALTSVPVASLYVTLASGGRQNLSMTGKDSTIKLNVLFKSAVFLASQRITFHKISALYNHSIDLEHFPLTTPSLLSAN